VIIQLGDMTVIGTPPAKLLKAIAVISEMLHPSFNANPNIKPDHSKRSCVLCSLTVRDFLQAIGFADASVASVSVVMFASRGSKPLHSIGIGVPIDNRKIDGQWCGHMVATVAGWVIDTTLYQAKRPQWPDLTGQIAVPLYPPGAAVVRMFDWPMITGFQLTKDDGYQFLTAWCDRKDNNTWHRGPDAVDIERRRPSVDAMVACFGPWDD
jgi:hypothetical protein